MTGELGSSNYPLVFPIRVTAEDLSAPNAKPPHQKDSRRED